MASISNVELGLISEFMLVHIPSFLLLLNTTNVQYRMGIKMDVVIGQYNPHVILLDL